MFLTMLGFIAFTFIGAVYGRFKLFPKNSDRGLMSLFGMMLGLIASIALMFVVFTLDNVRAVEQTREHALVSITFNGTDSGSIFYTSGTTGGVEKYFYYYKSDDSIVTADSSQFVTDITVSSATPKVIEHFKQCLEWYCFGDEQDMRYELVVPQGATAGSLSSSN